MGLFRRERRSAAGSDAALSAFLAAQRSGTTASLGVSDPDQAMRLAAVWSCFRILAGIGASLPLDQFRDGVPMRRARLWDEPFPGQTLPDWSRRLWMSVLTDGNAYGIVSRDTDAQMVPRSVELIDPRLVSWRADGDRWVTSVSDKEVERWPNGPLWHLPVFTTPGIPWGAVAAHLCGDDDRCGPGGVLVRRWLLPGWWSPERDPVFRRPEPRRGAGAGGQVRVLPSDSGQRTCGARVWVPFRGGADLACRRRVR